jgi:putative endonuclease
MADRRKVLGAEGERAAEKYLRRQKYTILERNYRCPLGEIDLIALDGKTVVFIEVKTRTGERHGGPLEAVDARKQRQIGRVAQSYLLRHRLQNRTARFDVVGVSWDGTGIVCELVRNAFDLPT